jgi:Tol biopolymer transport system component
VSDESGRDEIYLQPFPGPGGKVPVSTEGGVAPAWSPTGRELFYLSGDGMMSVVVTTGTVGAPTFLFEKPDIGSSTRVTGEANYDVTADGERFLMVVSGDTSTQLNVVLNWFDELERLVPSDR